MPWQANNNAPGALRCPGQLPQDSNTISKEWKVYSLQSFPFLPPFSHCGYVHPSELPNDNSSWYSHPRSYSPNWIQILGHEDIPKQSIALSEIQCINLEICVKETMAWKMHPSESNSRPSSRVQLEVRLRHGQENAIVEMKAGDIINEMKKKLHNGYLAENERILIQVGLHELFVRVVELFATEEDDDDDFICPQIDRAYINEDTCFAIMAENPNNVQFLISGQEQFEASALKNIVWIETNDEEEFPVKRKLLYPCIKLTSAVQAGHGVHSTATNRIKVDVDCNTFDKVLLYLEHEVRGETRPYQMDPIHTDALLSASKQVGCIGLQEECERRLGEFETRVRPEAIRWSEVVLHNEQGDIWLMMDGMILDVTRWLTEHPGGSSIIPEQALNMDCTVFFELYHSSRQSFRYIKQFYIGELSKEDRNLVPTSERPSDAFLEELQAFTSWRIIPKEKEHVSF